MDIGDVATISRGSIITVWINKDLPATTSQSRVRCESKFRATEAMKSPDASASKVVIGVLVVRGWAVELVCWEKVRGRGMGVAWENR